MFLKVKIMTADSFLLVFSLNNETVMDFHGDNINRNRGLNQPGMLFGEFNDLNINKRCQNNPLHVDVFLAAAAQSPSRYATSVDQLSKKVRVAGFNMMAQLWAEIVHGSNVASAIVKGHHLFFFKVVRSALQV